MRKIFNPRLHDFIAINNANCSFIWLEEANGYLMEAGYTSVFNIGHFLFVLDCEV